MANTIQEKIKSLRQSKGFTQEEIANELGVCVTAYKKFENRQYKKFSSVAPKFAEYFGISEAELYYEEGTLKDEKDYKEQLETLKTYYSIEIRKLNAELKAKEEEIARLSDMVNLLLRTIDSPR